jgi:hypothetical protein
MSKKDKNLSSFEGVGEGSLIDDEKRLLKTISESVATLVIDYSWSFERIFERLGYRKVQTDTIRLSEETTPKRLLYSEVVKSGQSQSSRPQTKVVGKKSKTSKKRKDGPEVSQETQPAPKKRNISSTKEQVPGIGSVLIPDSKKQDFALPWLPVGSQDFESKDGIRSTRKSGGALGMLEAYCPRTSNPKGVKWLIGLFGDCSWDVIASLVNYCCRIDIDTTARACKALDFKGVDLLFKGNIETGIRVLCQAFSLKPTPEQVQEFLAPLSDDKKSQFVKLQAVYYGQYLQRRFLNENLSQKKRGSRRPSSDSVSGSVMDLDKDS